MSVNMAGMICTWRINIKMVALKNKISVQDRKAYEDLSYGSNHSNLGTTYMKECEQLHTSTALLKAKEAVLRFRGRWVHTKLLCLMT